MLYWSDSFRKPYPFQADVVVDIGPVFEKKLAMLHCHASQVYEWLPWIDGRREPIPTDEPSRIEWLRQWVSSRTTDVADKYRAQLIARYGPERGKAIRHAEAFERCEYGSPLDDRQLQRFFGGI